MTGEGFPLGDSGAVSSPSWFDISLLSVASWEASFVTSKRTARGRYASLEIAPLRALLAVYGKGAVKAAQSVMSSSSGQSALPQHGFILYLRYPN